ncbi:hypothetical protein [Paenibacillus odorifer]|uniref:hypothetical protein n=1 Tax=Paenibacillus odorifer TaxID=189426 RepID=UPI000B9FC916|nr:hypothetical protein [Paenibacillus odorifer]OZQ66541.1 hypothetical protein CA596_27350 [Paenibacillus odorifer]
MNPFSDIPLVIRFLNNGLVGIILGAIIGYSTSYYFSSRKHLSYQKITLPLYLSGVNNITKTGFYRGNASAKLVRTYFYIWNSGNSVILNNDIPSLSPIKLTWKQDEGTPFEVSIVKETNYTNNVKFDINSRELEFEYLGVKDGVVIEIIHEKRKSPQLIGTVIGSKKSNLIKASPPSLFGKKLIYVRFRLLCLILIVALVGLYISSIATGYYPFFGIFAVSSQRIYLNYLTFFILLLAITSLFSNDIPKKLNFSIRDWIMRNNDS